MLSKFWGWYERNETLAAGVATGLFLLQIFHLYWLTTDIVSQKLLGFSLFNPTGIYELLIVLADYTEVPALIGTSLIYLNLIRKGDHSLKNFLFLVFLNFQWLHIFWITDEFVAETLLGDAIVGIPTGLAWIAIAIDYLELPVIFDTTKRFLERLK